MQVLKTLVIGMGVLIIAGLTAVGYGIYKKAMSPEAGLFPGPSAAKTAAPLSAFGEAAITLAPGCAVTGMETGGGRLFLRIGPGPGGGPAGGACGRILVLDPATGATLGAISVKRPPP